MGNTKRATATRGPKRGRGRPRVNAVGSQITYTNLGPEVRAAVDRLAAKERRSIALMLSVLVEEALRARRELK